MDEYKKIFNWLAENEEEDLTPSMLAHKASLYANRGYSVVDGKLVAPRTTIGFTEEDFEFPE